jgi:hypothetical protein
MNFRDIRRALGRGHWHRRRARYPDVAAECGDELALIAERRRSDLGRF